MKILFSLLSRSAKRWGKVRLSPQKGEPDCPPVLQAIAARRSIRRYESRAVPRPVIEQILRAGSLAPSSKNRQPWHFIVLSGSAREGFLKAMGQGLARERRQPLLPQSAPFLSGAEYTLQVMRQAPVIIALVNPLGIPLGQPLSDEERIYENCNAQSIGAAMENISLAAAALGLGSLWIGDSWFACRELEDYLQAQGTLNAVLALGYPAEAPAARPRRPLDGCIEWRNRLK
jgi:nitroreductase